jgi:hypothetical protein
MGGELPYKDASARRTGLERLTRELDRGAEEKERGKKRQRERRREERASEKNTRQMQATV